MTKTVEPDDPDTMMLFSGAEIPRADFGRIYGGGQKKALDRPRKLKVGDHELLFTVRDMSPVQEVIDLLLKENEFMRGIIGTDDKGRLRVRVRSNGQVVPPVDRAVKSRGLGQAPRRRRRRTYSSSTGTSA